jgi:hypothetical protein
MTSTFSSLLNGLLFAGALTVALWTVLHFIPRRALNAATRYVIWLSPLPTGRAASIWLQSQWCRCSSSTISACANCRILRQRICTY